MVIIVIILVLHILTCHNLRDQQVAAASVKRRRRSRRWRKKGRRRRGRGFTRVRCLSLWNNRTKLLINTLSRCDLVKLHPAGLGGSTVRFVSVTYSGASFKSGPCVAPRSAASPGDSRSSSLCGRNSLQV